MDEFVLHESSVMAEVCTIRYSWPLPMGYWPVCYSKFSLSSAVLPELLWPTLLSHGQLAGSRELGSSLQISSRMATGAKLLLWHPSAIQVLFFIPLFPVFLLPCQRNVALAESSILGNYLRYSLPEDPEIGLFLKLVPGKNQRKGRQEDRFVSFGAGTLRAVFAGSFCSPCEISGQSNKELASLGTSIPIVSTQMAWFSQEKPKNASSSCLQQVSSKAIWTWRWILGIPFCFLKLVSVNKGNWELFAVGIVPCLTG